MTSTMGSSGLLPPRFNAEYAAEAGYPKVRIVASAGRLLLSVQLSDSRFEKIEFEVGHGPTVIGFQDLVGNGPTAPESRHKKGYGKLLVNLAIQVLRRTEGLSADSRIHGLITDHRPAVADFWLGFGLSISGPAERGDRYITGRLGDLEPIERPYLAGDVFPLSLELSHFVVCE